ncbi:hypothetical protein D9758_014136 [Tetrapyrgos nigripes]|uniref:C2H2-type domain-containing protein n=1 Tax=Tetrapyrgos nigripes TaxID=182062 RepID=A0A8H5CPT4_9AGAR|nr:hypothetical protein D9758_014136 [Tetrapyrgos nigripes]
MCLTDPADFLAQGPQTSQFLISETQQLTLPSFNHNLLSLNMGRKSVNARNLCCPIPGCSNLYPAQNAITQHIRRDHNKGCRPVYQRSTVATSQTTTRNFPVSQSPEPETGSSRFSSPTSPIQFDHVTPRGNFSSNSSDGSDSFDGFDGEDTEGEDTEGEEGEDKGFYHIDMHPLLNGQPCDKNGNYLPKGTPPPPFLDPPNNDYSLYENRTAFELADLLFRCEEMSSGNIDDLLRIWAADSDGDLPFANKEDLYETIDNTEVGDIPWESFALSYCSDLGSSPEPWMTDKFEVHYRNPDLILRNQLGNRDFSDEIDVAPKKKFDKNGRVYENLMEEAKKIKAEIDRRIAAVPYFPRLRRFPQGRGFKQWTGDDLKALMKVYLPAISGLVPSQIVRALGAFLEFCYLIHRNIINQATLDAIDAAVSDFHRECTVFADLGVRDEETGFSLPRQHSLSHYCHLIEEFGAPNGLCSSITESKHIQAVKKPWRRSSRFEALGQMLTVNQRLDKLTAARVNFRSRGMLDGLLLETTDIIMGHLPPPDDEDDDGSDIDDRNIMGEVKLACCRIRTLPTKMEELAHCINVPQLPFLIN